jgi:hypothetical protein
LLGSSGAEGHARDDELSGIVLDARNGPVPGADIEVTRNVGRDMNTMDPAYVQQENVVAESKSDADPLSPPLALTASSVAASPSPSSLDTLAPRAEDRGATKRMMELDASEAAA